MSKIKLNLKELSASEKIAKAKQIISALTGNPAFPTPQPALTLITAAAEKLQTSLNDAQTARQTAITKTNIAHTDEDDLEGVLRQSAAYVESMAGDDEAKILSAGMSIRSAASSRPVSAAPGGLTATEGDHDGELDLSWDKVNTAKSYEIQQSPDPPTGTSWAHAAVSTKSSATVSGLTSGTRYWFRVRAVTAAGPSGWSDPATKIAP